MEKNEEQRVKLKGNKEATQKGPEFVTIEFVIVEVEFITQKKNRFSGK